MTDMDKEETSPAEENSISASEDSGNTVQEQNSARSNVHDELHDPNSREPVRHFKRLGRELAMQFLYCCDIAGTDELAQSLENFWEQAGESGKFAEGRIFRKGKAYAEKMITGVLTNKERIDSLIEHFSRKWDITRMPIVDKNIMRVAIFELEFCPDIPAVVSIDEAIELSKEFGSDKSAIFINGILNGVKAQLPPGAKLPSVRKSTGKIEKKR